MAYYIKKAVWTSLFMFLGVSYSYGQKYKQSIWLSNSIRISLDKNASASFSRQDNYSKGKFTWSQTSFSINHKLAKRVGIRGGFVGTKYHNSQKFEARLSVGVGWYRRRSPFRNTFLLNYFYPKTKKYGTRLSYQIRWQKTVKWKHFKIYPFTAVRLFYFLNGQPRTYYNSDGEKMGKFSTNGLHRMRLISGFSIRPLKFLKLQSYVVLQQEFNLPISKKHHYLNTINPNSGKTKNRFSNKIVYGLSLQYRLTAYGKEKKKRREEYFPVYPLFEYSGLF